MEWNKEIDLLFDKWIEISIEKGEWFYFSIKEIYDVDPKYQGVLGKTDSRPVFELGFRLPFKI
ncbi:hypothetical protein H6G33_10185 [Calothrix sp. FACHB-1219]|uniref:hypothetical protein n=1 Tax=unclassified Calothrix TaxID=2619626 RepID=UPI00168504D6|nr:MULTISPECIES: hypothetical protein [unclassified Calothrix]MBD2201716.1 hypothetical protein [Calothrix sp. FACHB-168]MBD2217402.1 hypothetical protein [Calothrix sp. FACHB-1219]